MSHGVPYDGMIPLKWVLIWIAVCGLPCALAMGLPPWPLKKPESDSSSES